MAPILTACLVAPPIVGAQSGRAPTVTMPVVIAAFLLNFAKFVEWPPDVLTADAPLVMCVADSSVADAVSGALKNRPAAARPISMKPVTPSSIAPDCGVVYVADLDARQMTSVLTTLRGRSVLSVSNAEDFAKRGGMIELFLDGGHMRFAVNPQAAERSRLRVSSQLLSLARIVKE